MSTRRDFLKGSLAMGVAIAASRVGRAEAATSFPTALIYTKDAPGRWAGKEAAHAPQVTIAAGKITVMTPHPMTPAHFIVKHTIISPEGRLIGERTFTGADAKAESVYDLPADFKGTLWCSSDCNLHDLWVTEVVI
ncbi:MAG TPA: desulfoferrodoxin family protein [bacterium]